MRRALLARALALRAAENELMQGVAMAGRRAMRVETQPIPRDEMSGFNDGWINGEDDQSNSVRAQGAPRSC